VVIVRGNGRDGDERGKRREREERERERERGKTQVVTIHLTQTNGYFLCSLPSSLSLSSYQCL
jgi:hypothetical protein